MAMVIGSPFDNHSGRDSSLTIAQCESLLAKIELLLVLQAVILKKIDPDEARERQRIAKEKIARLDRIVDKHWLRAEREGGWKRPEFLRTGHGGTRQ